MKKLILLAMVAAAAISSQAAVMYDSMTGVTSYTTTGSSPAYLLGDGATTIAPTLQPDDHWEINSIDFGVFLLGAQSWASGQLIARIDVFSSFAPGNVAPVSVMGPLAGTAFYALPALTSTTNAAYGITGGALGTPIVLPVGASTMGFTVSFFDNATGLRTQTARAAVSTTVAPAVGTSNFGFYRDNDDNGVITSTDLRTLTSGGANDNIIIRFNATSVPEPASLAVLGLGLVGLVARRRKSSK